MKILLHKGGHCHSMDGRVQFSLALILVMRLYSHFNSIINRVIRQCSMLVNDVLCESIKIGLQWEFQPAERFQMGCAGVVCYGDGCYMGDIWGPVIILLHRVQSLSRHPFVHLQLSSCSPCLIVGFIRLDV